MNRLARLCWRIRTQSLAHQVILTDLTTIGFSLYFIYVLTFIQYCHAYRAPYLITFFLKNQADDPHDIFRRKTMSKITCYRVTLLYRSLPLVSLGFSHKFFKPLDDRMIMPKYVTNYNSELLFVLNIEILVPNPVFWYSPYVFNGI